VSVATPTPAATTAAALPAREMCPLCSAPLDPEQEWCLRCGAAARTRLAASPAWKAPVLVLAVLAALSLGVLAAALVTLAGGSNTSTTAAPATTTVTTAPAVTAPTTAVPGGTTIPPTTASPATAPDTTTTPTAPATTPSHTSSSTTPPTSNPLFAPPPKK
jgi:hypothetical protein